VALVTPEPELDPDRPREAPAMSLVVLRHNVATGYTVHSAGNAVHSGQTKRPRLPWLLCSISQYTDRCTWLVWSAEGLPEPLYARQPDPGIQIWRNQITYMTPSASALATPHWASFVP
jgi:hypothetical protein